MMMGLDVQLQEEDDTDDQGVEGLDLGERLFVLADEARAEHELNRVWEGGDKAQIQPERVTIERKDEDEEEEGISTPTPKPRPFATHHHHAPLPPYVALQKSERAIPTGATTSSTPDSEDTPIDIQNQRKRRLERERLAKLNDITPTRPNPQGNEARMFWDTGSSKRSFAELDATVGDGDGDDGSDDEGDGEMLDPRRKLFSPRLSVELETQDVEMKEEKKGSITPHRSEDEQDAENEVLDTPFNSSEYKQSDGEISGKLIHTRLTWTKLINKMMTTIATPL